MFENNDRRQASFSSKISLKLKNYKNDRNFWTIRTRKILDPDLESSWKFPAYETIQSYFDR